MANSTGLQFTVSVDGGSDQGLAVVDFALEEALSAPFTLQLSLASPRPDIQAAELLEHPCELLIWFDGQLQRRISGVVSQFAQGDTGFRRTRYQLEVRPALWRLGLRHNSRIFQALTPQEIISVLLQEAGIGDYAFALQHPHAQREYCVQYRESDLDFVQRLAAEEGLFYFHEFTANGHRLVLADTVQALSSGPDLFFNPANQGLQHGAFIRRLSCRQTVAPDEVALKDYSFKTPAYGLLHQAQAGELPQQHYEHFDYPGRFKADPSGQAFTGYRLDALRAEALCAQGSANAASLRPGQRFSLSEHPNPACNIPWQPIRIQHTGRQPQALEEEGGGEATVYFNDFTLVPASTPWRPQPMVKPRVDGPQIATVVGPQGEEIYCDEHGRVKLQFPWDRYGSSDERSSCWVRVAQGWAGGQYGMLALPRIGHEVIVSFLEGDPDQPIVTGRTFHATNRPPYALPEHKTRTVLRTETHQGEGFNELRFEDQAGAEEIYLHGQKDLNVLIENDAAWQIKHDLHTDIGNERVTRVCKVPGRDGTPPSLGNDHLTVQGEKRDHIQQDYSLTVDGSQHHKLGHSLLVEAGSQVHHKAGMKIVLEAGAELTLKVGGNFVKLDPSGVTLSGASIKMNSGGSPGSGAGWAGKAPKTIEAIQDVPHKHWMKFYHLDSESAPLAGTPYKALLSDGSVREGTLDDDGMALLEDVPSGPASVTYEQKNEFADLPREPISALSGHIDSLSDEV